MTCVTCLYAHHLDPQVIPEQAVTVSHGLALCLRHLREGWPVGP